LFLFSVRFFVLPSDTVLRKLKRKLKILLNLKSYRSSRHLDFLPVRGQRTRSNAGTMRILRQKQQ
jgi:ribosomal protein S13